MHNTTSENYLLSNGWTFVIVDASQSLYQQVKVNLILRPNKPLSIFLFVDGSNLSFSM